VTQHSDVFTEAIKASPTITVGGLTLFGVGLADWVLFTTLSYTVLQIFFLLRDKWYRPRKDKNGRN
jgi:hypothetical protein